MRCSRTPRRYLSSNRMDSSNRPSQSRATTYGRAADAGIPVTCVTQRAQSSFKGRSAKAFGSVTRLEGGHPIPGQRAGRGGTQPAGGHGPAGGGERGGGRGPGGPMGGMFSPERSTQRYSLTFSANARNLFNKVNSGTPIGNLSSPQFGQSTALAGRVFNTQAATRSADLQVMFSF